MSESALAFFLATRDPATVAREWSSADPAQVRVEGMSKRDAGRERLRHLTEIAGDFDPPACAYGHLLSERSWTISRGVIKPWCKACKRESNRKYRARLLARGERNTP